MIDVSPDGCYRPFTISATHEVVARARQIKRLLVQMDGAAVRLFCRGERR